jgi:hypothetical protein
MHALYGESDRHDGAGSKVMRELVVHSEQVSYLARYSRQHVVHEGVYALGFSQGGVGLGDT